MAIFCGSLYVLPFFFRGHIHLAALPQKFPTLYSASLAQPLLIFMDLQLPTVFNASVLIKSVCMGVHNPNPIMISMRGVYVRGMMLQQRYT
jgi:hypothetical protein